jgi:hypothetical protein
MVAPRTKWITISGTLHYSLLLTTRRNKLAPDALLSDVLVRTLTYTQANLSELLPWNWKPRAV